MTQRFDLRNITALEHMLTEMFGSPERFGIKVPLPPGIMADAGKVVLTIASADGKLSDNERNAFIGILRAYGAPEDEIRAIQAFTPTPQMIDNLVQQGTPPFLRALVYDAIRVARVDGFHAKEREMTERVVKKLGLDAGLVAGIEALLHVEDVVTAARARLLNPPMALPSGWETPRLSSGVEARAATFGPAGAIQLPREFHVAIVKAILGVASGDRDLGDAELRWFAGNAKVMGTPEGVFEEGLKVDYQNVPFEEIFDNRLRPYAAVVLYTALQGARADGVSARERAMAERAADRFGLDATFVTAVINQLDIENGAREARIGLLAPLR